MSPTAEEMRNTMAVAPQQANSVAPRPAAVLPELPPIANDDAMGSMWTDRLGNQVLLGDVDGSASLT